MNQKGNDIAGRWTLQRWLINKAAQRRGNFKRQIKKKKKTAISQEAELKAQRPEERSNHFHHAVCVCGLPLLFKTGFVVCLFFQMM